MVTVIRLRGVGKMEPIHWLHNNISEIKKHGRLTPSKPFIGEGWRLTWVLNTDRRNLFTNTFTEVEIDDQDFAIEFKLKFL